VHYVPRQRIFYHVWIKNATDAVLNHIQVYRINFLGNITNESSQSIQGGETMIIGTIVRFIVSALVLLLVGWLLPGISVSGFTGALLAAVVIAVLGYVIETLLGDKISPQRRGLVGFATSAVVIYLAQFIVPNFLSVNVIGALLAALVIGIIDAIVPTELR
jgi:putative membrane protein